MTKIDKPFRFGVIGCGFWAQTQLRAWQELEDVELSKDIEATDAELQRLAERREQLEQECVESLDRSQSDHRQ